MNQKILVIGLILLAVLIAGCVKLSEINQQYQTDVYQNKTTFSCDKEANCCVENEDCKYIWYTGRCNTPEYVAKTQKEAQEQGMHIDEAPPRENVTCSCENNKCITHNQKYCQNFPPPSFCPGGINDIIVTGTDDNGCSTYGCKSEIQKYCQNFPPPNFCPGGINDIIVTGTDDNGCSTYGCKSEI